MSIDTFRDLADSSFRVHPDGTVVGDDGYAGRVAAAMSHVARLSSNLADLLGVEELARIETLGTPRLSADVEFTAAREASVRAQCAVVVPRERRAIAVVGGTDVSAALTHCVGRVGALGGVAWSGVVTHDMRLVAACLTAHDAAFATVLPRVGSRALGILRALPADLVSDGVALHYPGLSLWVAPVGENVLVVGAPDRVVEDEWTQALDEVRAVLAGQNVTQAPAWGEAPPLAVVEEESPPARVAAPVGARFRGRGRR